MIVIRERLGSLALLGTCQGSVVPAIIPKIVLAAAVGVFAKLLKDGLLWNEPNPKAIQYSFEPFTALGVAISLFLGFHNNASYARWWEARILWGTQIIAMRNLIRFLLGSLGSDDEERNGEDDDDDNNNNNNNNNIIDQKKSSSQSPTTQSRKSATINTNTGYGDESWGHEIIRLGMAQTHALRSQLRPRCRQDRPGSALQDRDRFLTPHEVQRFAKSRNPANAILLHVGTLVGQAHWKRKQIDSYQMIQLSKLIDELCNIQTACERIHNTSLPLAYSLLVHRTATIYVLLAPFAIVDRMGWWTPVFTAILGYTFYGLDELARQIQDPFSDEPACLALSAMCRTVEIDVCEALQRDVPPALKPIKSVLM